MRMKNFNEMTVTIKLKSYEFQSMCELIKRSEETNKKNIDGLELTLSEKAFVSSVFKRLTCSGYRKANRLETIGTEVRNSIDFVN